MGEMKMSMLPEDCISRIISFTSPINACRLSLVCRLFRSAADSDVVWGRFLPHDLPQILSKSALASSMGWLSKKKLFFRLSHHPVLVGDDCYLSFAIDKRSGKKCYMIGARRLSIIWGDTPAYWQFIPNWRSRFPKVAQLNHVWWFEIKGRIETNILSQKTTYAAYFVYKLRKGSYGLEVPINIRVYFEGQEETNGAESTCTLVLDKPDNFEDPNPPPQDTHKLPQDRGDLWMEVEIGEFYNCCGCGADGVVICSLMEVEGTVKSGLIVEGIELRPKA